MDAVQSLTFPGNSVDGVTQPSEQPTPPTTNASATTQPDRHYYPTPLRPSYDCSSCPCRALAQRLREKLDFSIDPCQDFYKFVCNSFRGHNESENVSKTTANLSTKDVHA
ncbi:hypothetical protein MRX96_047906 [Rhipicephalus microplus]